MRRLSFIAVIAAIFYMVLFFQFGCSEEGTAKPKTQAEMIALWKYIVQTTGCDDCYMPKIFIGRGLKVSIEEIRVGNKLFI